MGPDPKADLRRIVYLLLAVFLGVAALIAGRELLLPLAIAILLAFLLTPLVAALERRRVPRVVAVLGVIIVIFSGIGMAIWGLSNQISDLATNLPQYRKNLHQKLENVPMPSVILKRIRQIISAPSDVAPSGSTPTDAAPTKVTPTKVTPTKVTPSTTAPLEEVPTVVVPASSARTGVVPSSEVPAEITNIPLVRVVPDDVVPFEQVRLIATVVLAPLANAVIILALVVFMLVSREDLRNRLVRLMGKRLALTTRTLDAVGDRISSYLLMNALVNGGFGLCLAIGLSIIGVQYAFTWGLLAAALRFIPYVGPMFAAIMPIGMASLQFAEVGWNHAIYTAVLFAVMELVANNVIEPMVYGPHTGVSTVALLVAAMFWSWVWGPLGLVLAVPLTVVLAVLGEYVETLKPLAILLGDKPALDPFIVYYQRLLAGDVDEASAIFTHAQKSSEPIGAYDQVVIPALAQAQKDAATGELLEAEQQLVWQSIKEQVEGQDLPNAAVGRDLSGEPAVKAKIVACPAHDVADGMCIDMLRQVLHFDEFGSFESLSATMLAGEMSAAVAQRTPDAVLISALGQSNLRSARYLCTRLRQVCPLLRILVGYWGPLENRDQLASSLRDRGADQLVTTLAEARDAMQRIMPIPPQKKAEKLAVPVA